MVTDNMDENKQTDEQQIEKQIKDALANEEIPTIYFNGFINTVGIGDVMLILTLSGKSVAILNMSYTLAKTLAERLGGTIAEIERKSGNTIMTTDDVKQLFTEDSDETE